MSHSAATNSPDFDLNTALFESTFKIEQPINATQSAIGATFMLVRPYPNDPNRGRFVLVTAKHVLEGMKGDEAIWHLRLKDEEDQWQRSPVTLKIRTGGQPHWVSHPTADVAAMYVSLRPGVIAFPLPADSIADASTFEYFEFHPGDGLNCLGYPLGQESNAAGFPILRSGKVASYPLYPAKAYPTFLCDFESVDGDSGGPVYLVESNRSFKGTTHMGTVQFLAGLVSRQQVTQGNERLALSVVVSAPLILETINLLPPPDLAPSPVVG